MLINLLATEIFTYSLVFIRISTALFIFPGFSSAFVPSRIRLFIALGITMASMGLVKIYLPAMPDNLIDLSYLIFREVAIGAFIGLFPQFIMAALDFAGSIMGHSVGFSNAQAFDPTMNTQSTVISSFLSFIAFTLIVVMDLHHTMIVGVMESYTLFPAGEPLMFGDFADFLRKYLNKSFHIGFQIAAPFFLMSVIFNVGTGVISRLMPQLHVLFIMMPLQVYLGIGLLFLALPICMMAFMLYFEQSLYSIFRM